MSDPIVIRPEGNLHTHKNDPSAPNTEVDEEAIKLAEEGAMSSLSFDKNHIAVAIGGRYMEFLWCSPKVVVCRRWGSTSEMMVPWDAVKAAIIFGYRFWLPSYYTFKMHARPA